MILTRRSALGALGATTAADGEHTVVHAGSALVVELKKGQSAQLVVRGGALVRA